MRDNREIAFRAWDKKRKEWFIVGHNPLWVKPPIHENYDDLEVTEYSGLKDRLDNMIYEGDILKERDGIGVVEFKDGEFLAMQDVKDGAINMLAFSDLCDVIGNIYQNPELLTNQTNTLTQSFNKIFANLPLGLRSDIIYVDQRFGPMTWHVVKLEVDATTPVGQRALKTLKEMKII